MHEPLKYRTYIGKKLFFNFLGTDFSVPKSSHQCEKQPLLGPAQSWLRSSQISVAIYSQVQLFLVGLVLFMLRLSKYLFNACDSF